MEVFVSFGGGNEPLVPSHHQDLQVSDSKHELELDNDDHDNREVVQTRIESIARISSTESTGQQEQCFKELGLEAERLQKMFKDIGPNLNILDVEGAHLCKRMKKSFVKKDSRVRRFQCELELLTKLNDKSKSELLCMESYVANLLRLVGKTSSGFSDDDLQKDETMDVSAQLEFSNMGECLEDSSSDCESLTTSEDQDMLDSFVDPTRRQTSKGVSETKVGPEGSNAGTKLHDHPLNKSLIHPQLSADSEVSSCLNNNQKDSSDTDHAEKVQPDQKEFIVQECGNISNSFKNIWNHKGINQPRQSIIYSMKISIQSDRRDVCRKASKTETKQHKFTHSGEKSFPCEVCGRKFVRKRNADLCKHSKKRENKLITQQTQHVCKVCNELFKSKKKLIIHKRQVHNLSAAEIWPCLICDNVFDLKEDLYNHLTVHSRKDNEPLECQECHEKFGTPSDLRKHLFQHSQNFECEMCEKKFFKAESFRQHQKFHKEQVTCQVCGRVLSSASRLKEHMNVHTGEKPYECDVCHLKLSSRSAVENHKRRTHNSKTNGGNKCYICGEAFKTPFARNTHQLKEHSEEERRLHNIVVKTFTCDICGETIRKEYKVAHLKRHEIKSNSERLCICEICGEEFAGLPGLRFHMANFHTSTQKLEGADHRLPVKKVPKACETTGHVCDICGKEFGCRLYLEYHRVVHFDERPFSCNICSKSFKLKHQLKLHEKTHNGSEPFQCEFCGKKFLFQASFEAHIRTHSAEKPFACPVCGAVFNQEANMRRHVSLVHKNERRFQCDVCDKRFNSRSVLKVHTRIHTGEKPFTCEICGSSFSDPSTFYKHKAIHTRNSSKT